MTVFLSLLLQLGIKCLGWQREDLSVIQKFQYLQSSLTDEAKHCLAGLAITAANYSVAKDLLQKRFGIREKIVQQHIQGLLYIS